MQKILNQDIEIRNRLLQQVHLFSKCFLPSAKLANHFRRTLNELLCEYSKDRISEAMMHCTFVNSCRVRNRNVEISLSRMQR